MSNWYDNGIKGKDNSLICSSVSRETGAIFEFNNLRYTKTVALTQGENNSTYSVLLVTTGSGTQLYMEIKRSLGHKTFYRPYQENKAFYKFDVRFYLRKNGVNHYVSEDYQGIIGYTLDDNIYLYHSCSPVNNPIVVLGTNDFDYYMDPFPKGMSNVMNNASICFSPYNNGIRIYTVGFTCRFNGVIRNNPSYLIGFIPNTILNNQEFFNPAEDGVTENDKEQAGEDGRPTNSNYAGNDIDFPGLPTGASALGLSTMTMYNPTSAQLSQAFDILYTDSTESTLEQIVESAKKWWYKPQQYCVSVMLTPVPVSTGSSKEIYFGKYDTGVAAPVVNSQWQIVDCGTLSVPLMYGNYLDFSHVQIMIYLPFIGFRNINVQEIMGGSLAIKYYIDIYTGSGVCFIKCTNKGGNSSVLYTYECNVNTQVPITSNDYSMIVTNLIKASVSVGATMATGGIAAGLSGASLLEGAISSQHTLAAAPIQTSGCLTPNTGVLGNSKPYLVLHFPVSIMDNGYTTINGKVSDYTANVGELNGFNAFKEIHLDNIDLPAEVLQQVESQFRTGVII